MWPPTSWAEFWPVCGGNEIASAGSGYLVSFDKLAPHYRWMEFVLAGEKLQRARTAFLPQVTDAQRILILGEGNGRFLTACRHALPNARITCVDASARMLAIARSRLMGTGQSLNKVEFVTANALMWPAPANSFDLIVTHFFLDCFAPQELDHVVTNLARAARPKAAWLLADFQTPAGGVARYRAVAIHRLMYFFFRAVTGLSARKLTNPDALFQRHGFALRDRSVSDWGLLRADWWQR